MAVGFNIAFNGFIVFRLLLLVHDAMIDVLFAAVRLHVATNELPPQSVEQLIATAYAALIKPSRGLGHRRREKSRRGE
jgi:hypothetical protein